MSDRSLSADLMDQEIDAICRRYKISSVQAREMIDACFEKQPKLLDRIEQEQAAQDVTRWKDYRRTIKEVRKQVYYQLRRYHADREEEARLREELGQRIASGSESETRSIIDDLAGLHVSTRERAHHLADFHVRILLEIGEPRSILDIGCGYHPLTFPFPESLLRYVALEKDAETCETIEVFAPAALPTKLVTVCGSFTETDFPALLPQGELRFDVAFLFKLVPVIARSDPNALQALADLPVDTFVLTASMEAMTRTQDVSRREDRVLRTFIEQTGRTQVDRFEIGNELGYFVR